MITCRLVFLYALLLLLQACNNISDKSAQSTNDGALAAPTNQKDADVNLPVTVTVIPEQDPDGIFWGLRDTVSGKLALDYTYQKIWGFSDGFALVKLNGKYGLINKTGKLIIGTDYDFPQPKVNCGFIAYEIGNGPIAIIDTTGKSVMPLVYGMTGLLPCEQRVTFGQYQYGMRSFSGDTLLPFKFTYAHVIPEGFCIASKADETNNRLYGLYDLNGKQVLPHVFESIDDFYGGRSIVKKDGKYGAIDQTGKELFYTEYSRVDRFYNDYAIVYKKQNKENRGIGIIDKNGREVVPAIYQWLDYVYSFSEGLAAMAQDWKYGFVDTNGEVVIPFKYDKVESFQSGIAKVWLGKHRYAGYINKKGEEIIPANFEAMDQANLRRHHGKYIIGIRDSAQHVFDYSGKEIAVLNYQSIGAFDGSKKTFIVSMDNKMGILDSNFQVKIPLEYESLERTFPDKITARKNGKIGFIDQKGKVISPFVYDWIEPLQDDSGLTKVVIKGKTGIINSYGKLIIPAKYDEVEGFSHGLSVVKRNNKYGFVDAKGKEVIPPKYDEASSYTGYTAAVTLKGETFQIDISGKRVEEEEY